MTEIKTVAEIQLQAEVNILKGEIALLIRSLEGDIEQNKKKLEEIQEDILKCIQNPHRRDDEFAELLLQKTITGSYILTKEMVVRDLKRL